MATGELIVDLEGGLLPTGHLGECLAAAATARPGAALRATLAGLAVAATGREGLREALTGRLAAVAAPDPATLPWDPETRAAIGRARAGGRTVTMVTGADPAAAEPLARHLGIDEVRPRTGPPERRRRSGRGLRPCLAAMRPHHWLKNLLLLMPALAAHTADPAAWAAAALGAAAFCLAASAVYILNDIADLAADRAHPSKRRRPFARGAAHIGTGAALAAGLVAGAGLAALALPAGFGLALGLYLALTTAYSLALKRLLLIDIFTLAGLFSLRVLAGAEAAAIALSPWMIGVSGFLFLALAATKRVAELAGLEGRGGGAAAGRAWRAEDLPVAAAIAIAAAHAAAVVLALYIADADVQARYAAPALLWAAPPVLLYWCARLVLLARRGYLRDDPLDFAARDATSLLCGAAIAAAGLLAAIG